NSFTSSSVSDSSPNTPISPQRSKTSSVSGHHPPPTEDTTISHNAVLYTFNPGKEALPSSPHTASPSPPPSPHVLPSPTSSPSSKFTPSTSTTNWVSSVAFFSATYEVHADPGWLNRSIGVGVGSLGVRVSGVASCDPSPCLNNGRCITEGTNHSCLCTNGFTGAFC
ncbi:putative EGF-like domain-containing protein, partial [Homarus americanus]